MIMMMTMRERKTICVRFSDTLKCHRYGYVQRRRKKIESFTIKANGKHTTWHCEYVQIEEMCKCAERTHNSLNLYVCAYIEKYYQEQRCPPSYSNYNTG